MGKAHRKTKGQATQEYLERLDQAECRSRVLGIPIAHAFAVWSSSLAGCLIHLCEYGEGEDANALQRQYWAVYQDYIEVLRNESKALGSKGGYGGSPSVDYDEDSEGYIDWCNRARYRAESMREHLKAYQNSVGIRCNVPFIQRQILNEDMDSSNWKSYAHAFPQLRGVLDSLDKFLNK